MVMATIEHAPIIDDRFVVHQADVDIFDSMDDLEGLVAAASTSASASASAVPSSPDGSTKKNKKKKKHHSHGTPKSKKSQLRRMAARQMGSFSTLPEDSVDLDGVERILAASSLISCDGSSSSYASSSLPPLPYSSRGSRRSSLCSTTSSNSSVCSKSFGFTDGDESIVSCSDDASSLSQAAESSPSSTSPASSRGSSKRRATHRHHHHHHHDDHTKEKKNVLFAPRVTVRSIPDVEDYSPEERTQVWYTEQELMDIKQDAQELMQLAKERKLPHTADELRGLHMTQKRQRRSSWVMALTCVLDEQKRQAREHRHHHHHSAHTAHTTSSSDPDTLAKLYRSFAFAATQIALKIGQEDAQSAAAAASASATTTC